MNEEIKVTTKHNVSWEKNSKVSGSIMSKIVRLIENSSSARN